MSRSEIQERVSRWLRDNPSGHPAFLANPRQVMAEQLGIELPPEVDVEIILENNDTLYVVLPHAVERGAELTDSDLDAATGGHLRVQKSPVCGGGNAPLSHSMVNLEADLLI